MGVGNALILCKYVLSELASMCDRHVTGFVSSVIDCLDCFPRTITWFVMSQI